MYNNNVMHNFRISVDRGSDVLEWLTDNMSPITTGNQYYKSGNGWYFKRITSISEPIGHVFVQKSVTPHLSVTIIDNPDAAIAFNLTFSDNNVSLD